MGLLAFKARIGRIDQVNLRKKRLWLAMAMLTVVATAGFWIWAGSPKGPDQIITTPDGAKFRFAGVTWSREAVPPSIVVRILRQLPRSWVNWTRSRLGDRDSQYNIGEKWDQPRLVFWFLRMTTNLSGGSRSMQQRAFIPSAVLADEAGVAAGGETVPILYDNVVWSFVSFPLVPRRSKTIECLFFEGAYHEEAHRSLGKVKLSNPLFGHFPDWQPAPLPSVKQVGDLEVRLDSVACGHPQSGATILQPNGTRAPPLTPLGGGERIETQLNFSVRSARGTNEGWILHGSELSDATGNVIAERSQGSWVGMQFGPRPQADWRGLNDTLYGALWPNEAAWHLKVAFKRSFGFDSNEFVTFANIPIPAIGATNTNAIVAMNGNQKLVLKGFERHANIPSNVVGTFFDHTLTELTVEMPGKPPDLALDVWETRTDAGEALRFGRSELANSCTLSFGSIPTNATTLNLTLVLQKTRSVEFTFKPPKSGRGG